MYACRDTLAISLRSFVTQGGSETAFQAPPRGRRLVDTHTHTHTHKQTNKQTNTSTHWRLLVAAFSPKAATNREGPEQHPGPHHKGAAAQNAAGDRRASGWRPTASGCVSLAARLRGPCVRQDTAMPRCRPAHDETSGLEGASCAQTDAQSHVRARGCPHAHAHARMRARKHTHIPHQHV